MKRILLYILLKFFSILTTLMLFIVSWLHCYEESNHICCKSVSKCAQAQKMYSARKGKQKLEAIII